jgi:hypothetical protein
MDWEGYSIDNGPTIIKLEENELMVFYSNCTPSIKSLLFIALWTINVIYYFIHLYRMRSRRRSGIKPRGEKKKARLRDAERRSIEG